MSMQVENWFVEQWLTQVTMKYEAQGFMLKGMSQGPSKIVGKTLHFPIADWIEARLWERGSDAVPADGEDTEKTLDPLTYYAYIRVLEPDLMKLTADQMDIETKRAARALGVKHDKIVFDHMDTLSLTSVGAYNAAWTLGNALQVTEALDAADVPNDGMRFCGVPSNAWAQMLTYDQFNNSQYVGPDLPFVMVKERRTWNGVHWFKVSNKQLPLDGTDRDFFAWHREAIGTGPNTETLRVYPQFKNELPGWTVNHLMDFAAVELLTEGIIRCKCKNDAAIAFS